MVHQSQYCPYPCIFLNRASIVISDYHVGCCTGLLSFLQVLYSTKLSTDQPFIQVVSLMATAVEHLVTGETMQFSTSREQRRRLAISHHDSNHSIICNASNQEMQNKCMGSCFFIYFVFSIYFDVIVSWFWYDPENMCSMEYYLQKTYYKTASLISNSCKAVAVLTGHNADISLLAYEYGRNLVRNYPAVLSF